MGETKRWPSAVIEITNERPLEFSRQGMRVDPLFVIGTVLGLISAALTVYLTSVGASWLLSGSAFAIAAITLSTTYTSALQRRRGAWRSALEQGALSPERIRELVALARGDEHGLRLESLAKRLIANGVRDATYRVADSHRRFESVPIVLPFEPLPLKDAHRTLPPSTRAMARSQTGQAASQEPGAWKRRALRALVYWLVPAWLGILAIQAAWEDYNAGRISPGLIVIAFSVLVFLIHPWLRPQCWLVPGGLVLRRSPPFSLRWRVRPFARHESVLILGWLNGDRWAAWVADENGAATVKLSRLEAESLLRAWRSPLPPPAPEQLADLE